ncbi:hypothetical protein KUV80_00345 [Fictibacillus nanhaiensis]|uniref:hypothetical protein n=1 Tax=Fictibacillus nanhaiensis TaxID=742169 RepID=UPI001C9872A1|nr:hypothetical protein [Fictibacillus nanhaiensis]MBY6035080.1 hypothetical protein [Fictibacillus nanhaiensis]
MKKHLIIIFSAASLILSACSKEDIQEEQATAQAEVNSSDQTTEPADDSKKDTQETATPSEENTTSEPQTNSEDPPEGEDKEYITSNHQFVASEVTNLSEKEVSTFWGEPQRSEEIKFRYSGTTKFVPAVVHYYMDEKYAVTFVEGKAARLVYSVIDEEILFDEEKIRALELAGLPIDVEETTDTDTAFVWTELGDVHQVTMFSKGEFVDYLYIILDEAYK